MKLFLQTSSGKPSIVLWDGSLLFERNFAQVQRLDYGQELAAALTEIGANMEDITQIIVDIGPGRLGATRSAVAFANGLGFARKVPVVGLGAFVILGVYCEKAHARPCLVLRKAARRQFHWGLVRGGKLVETGFAPEGEIIPRSFQGPVVVAGDATPEAVSLPSLPDTLWSKIEVSPGTVLGLLEEAVATGPVVPLVETEARVFDAG
ncbi:MAG: hypothetical protein L3J37_00485 [Rhodobacteraceae bacterium]|nr:hypothetical protein [Paracoccaceae bacterium]